MSPVGRVGRAADGTTVATVCVDMHVGEGRLMKAGGLMKAALCCNLKG